MRLPESFLLELKARNDIESVVSGYVSLKRRGSNFVGLCPFHGERTPSFTLYPETNSFYCFGCGVGGDVIGFVRRIENIDYMSAVRLLADRAGMNMPDITGADDDYQMRSGILKANKLAARFYANTLLRPESAAAREYLLGRGLSPATIRKFGLGFAPGHGSQLYELLRENDISDRVIKTSNLCTYPDEEGKAPFDRFRGRVMFPILDVTGNVVAFSGRNLPGVDRGGKYVNTSNTPVYRKGMCLFGLFIAKNFCSERAILVEGNMDVISMHQAGFNNTVGALGTAFTREQALLLRRYTKEVVVMMDADDAGGKSTEKVIQVLRDTDIITRVLRLPDGKDPDEFLKNNSPAKLRSLIENAASDTEYLLTRAAEGLDLSADKDKVTYLRRAADVLAEVEDPITVELYAGRLSGAYGVEKGTLTGLISEKREAARKRRSEDVLREATRPSERLRIGGGERGTVKADAVERTVNGILIAHPDFYWRFKNELTAEDFITPFGRKLYETIAELYERGYNFDMSLLGEEFTVDEVSEVAVIVAQSMFGDDPLPLLQDCIATLKEEKKRLGDETRDWDSVMRDLIREKQQ